MGRRLTCGFFGPFSAPALPHDRLFTLLLLNFGLKLCMLLNLLRVFDIINIS